MLQQSRGLTAFRICKAQYDPLSGDGAAKVGGRWNRIGQPAIYAAMNLQVAQLELMAHLSRKRLPDGYVWAEITLPGDVTVEEIDETDVPHWHYLDLVSSQKFGSNWLASLRSVGLIVPSRAARPNGKCVILNPLHPDFKFISATAPEPIEWDERLFQT